MSLLGKKIGIEVGFSAGFSVAFCTPSSDFGVCIEGSIHLLEAKLTPRLKYTYTLLRDNAGRSAIGSKINLGVDWSIVLLSGAIEVSVVTPFFDTGYTLIEYEGFKVGEGTLVEWERVFRQDYK